MNQPDAAHGAAATRDAPRILFLITWFGSWPHWHRLYLQSCRHNPSVDFALITDCDEPDDLPPNVRLIRYGFSDYRDHIARTLCIRPRWDVPYKLCDFKPALGHLHRDLIAGYDYWGYGDTDVIYGDLRRFLTPEALAHDIVSSHAGMVAGHLCVVRNSEPMLTSFQRPRHWRWLLEHERPKFFDERTFSKLFLPGDPTPRRRGRVATRAPPPGKALFREQFSTALPGLRWVDGTDCFPDAWYWNRGRLTAEGAGDREFMYLHFTHWASKRWTRSAHAVWDSVDPLVRVASSRPLSFKISAAGFSDWSPVEDRFRKSSAPASEPASDAPGF